MTVASLPAFDPRSVEALRRAAKGGDQRAAVRGAAQQFEALMVQQLLKSMRATVPQAELFDSRERQMWQELSDQQLASDLAKGGGLGLAKMLERQWLPPEPPQGQPAERRATVDNQVQNGGAEQLPLPEAAAALPPVVERSFVRARLPVGGEPTSAPAPIDERSFVADRAAGTLTQAVGGAQPEAAAKAAVSASIGRTQVLEGEGTSLTPVGGTAAVEPFLPASASVPERIAAFVRQLLPAAQAASAELGVPAHFLIAQAALETGWGSAMLRRADGSPTHNLFNIKAGTDWRGETVTVRTTEYRRGRPQTEVAHFRAYPDIQTAFQDYVRLITTSERYAAARHAKTPEQFAQALTRGGYATDPHYAQKLVHVIKNHHFQTALAASGTKIA